MKQHELAPPEGARRHRRRVGRGNGSGRGTYCGKGIKGQKARSGGQIPPYFEGGQLPLVRRLPYRRGFTNPFRVEYAEVNVGKLNRFPSGSEVGPRELAEAGLLSKADQPVKVLGEGSLDQSLLVRAHRFSRAAREKIVAAGGTIQEIQA